MADPDLGGMIPPDEGQGKGTWTELVSDPKTKEALDAANRNMMISAGLQMMVPQWGGPMANVAMGLGKGFESAGKTADSIMANEQDIRNFNAKQQEGEATRASHEKVAQIGADSRLQVAQERVSGMLERAHLIRGPQGQIEMKMFLDAKNKYMHDEANNQLLSKMTRAQQDEAASAYAKESLEQARNATGIRSQGSALPGEEAAPNLASPTPPAAGVPAAPAASSAKSAPSFNELRQNPDFEKALSDPNFRAQLAAKRPDLSALIQQWETAQRASAYRR